MNERKFNKNIILAYSEFYDFINRETERKNEEKILHDSKIVESTNELFDLLLKNNDNDKGILWWKGALRLKRYYLDEFWKSEMKETLLNHLKKVREAPSISKEIVQNIVDDVNNGIGKGIGFPIASTIVYFFSQGNCPIIDWRALLTLKQHGYEIGYYDWSNYFDKCEEIKNYCGISFRELDKALWIYPDVCMNDVNKKNYLEISEMLKNLKIVDHPAFDEP